MAEMDEALPRMPTDHLQNPPRLRRLLDMQLLPEEYLNHQIPK